MDMKQHDIPCLLNEVLLIFRNYQRLFQNALSNVSYQSNDAAREEGLSPLVFIT